MATWAKVISRVNTVMPQHILVGIRGDHHGNDAGNNQECSHDAHSHMRGHGIRVCGWESVERDAEHWGGQEDHSDQDLIKAIETKDDASV